MEVPKRLVAIERKIKEITANDKRVRILGTVINSTPDFATFDDGTGMIHVKTEQPLEERKRYRIIGQIFKKADDKFEIHAEIVQDMSRLDMGLYLEVNEIKSKLNQTE